MIIFLYGPDSYRRQEKLKEIVSSHQEKHQGASLSGFDLEDDGQFAALKDFVKNQSLFEVSKLGVVRNAFSLDKTEQKEFIDLVKGNLDSKQTTILITEDGKSLKSFSFLLEAPVISQEFLDLEGVNLEKLILREAKKRGVVVDREGRELLMEFYKKNMWGLITELDKLALLDEKEINKEVVKKHFDALLPLNLFNELNDFRSNKKIGGRLDILENFLSRGQESAMIFNMMAVYPYANIQWKQKMADYDAAVKSGKLEYEEVLLDMCL